MAEKLVNPGFAVERVRGSNFTTNEVEEIGSTNNRLWTDAIIKNSLVVDAYDYVILTYVAAGNGAGEIETATYKTGGASGTTVAVLTLAYNASNEIETVTKT